MKIKEIGNNKKIRTWLIAGLIVIAGGVIAYFLTKGGMQTGTRGMIRSLRKYVRSWGKLGPAVVVFMIFVSIAVPPLPIPVPLLETIAGVVFGFGEGTFLIWLGQITAAVFSFYIAKPLKDNLFKILLKNKNWDGYRDFIKRKGATAVLITRLTMSSPFNIISYLAGLSDMKIGSFIWATAIGVIPEAVLYGFIGSRLRSLHINIWTLSTLVFVIGMVGFGVTMLITRSWQTELKTEKKV